MNTKTREPFPLFQITDWERETLLRVAEYYILYPKSERGICSIIELECPVSEYKNELHSKFQDVLDGYAYYRTY